MSTKQEQDNLRKQRLVKFFHDDGLIWMDIKEDILQCKFNAESQMKTVSCVNREWYAGKCSGLEEVLNIERDYKND